MPYVYVDGDAVGERIDALILQGDLDGLTRFTRGVDEAVVAIAAMAGAGVHMAGGDNVLAYVADVDEFLDRLTQHRFCCSFSVGIGEDGKDAHNALMVAKARGPGSIARAQRAESAVRFQRRVDGAREWTDA